MEVYLLIEGADEYHVKVRYGSEITKFYVNPDDTIESLKTKVASRIKRSNFSLVDPGTLDFCPFQRTLKRCGIENGQVLYVHLFKRKHPSMV